MEDELEDVDQTAIFPDPNGSSVTSKDLISKGSNVAVILQGGGFWFGNESSVLHGSYYKVL